MEQSNYVKGLVSVVIPTHNRSHLLKRAVKSVLNQTYKNFEVVIVNDGSNDDTESYLTQLSDKYNEVSVFSNALRKGAGSARNKGIWGAKGEYLTFLDDDDEFVPNRLEILLNSFEDKWSFICSSFLIKHNNKKAIANKGAKVITYDNVFWKNTVGNSILTYTDRIRNINGCDETLTSKIDYDLFARLIGKYGNALRIKDRLLIQYIDQDRLRIGTHSEWYKGQLKFYKKFRYEMSEDQRYFYRYTYYKRLKGEADVKTLLKSFKTLPWKYKYIELRHVLRKYIWKRLSVFPYFNENKK